MFCGKEIEIDFEVEECERLSPDIVKQKWRLEQISAIRNCDQPIRTKNKILSFPWNSGRDKEVDTDDTTDEGFVFPSKCPEQPCTAVKQQDSVHAVWSGWLLINSKGALSFLKQSKRWWSVLNVEHAQLMLECYVEDSATCAMTKWQTLALDPVRRARRETAALACGARARVSMAERGSGRRRSAACDTPEEADRLVCCINRLLASLDRRASPCSAAV